MQVIKPQKLAFLARSFEHQQRFHLGVAAIAFVPFGQRTLLPEIAMWKYVAEQLGKDATIDEAIPKLKSEYLVMGHVFTPGEEPLSTCPVRAQVGSLDKTLYAIGDRQWENGVPTVPTKFTTMPLAWEGAFGGDDFPANPVGKAPPALPNIEAPGRLVETPNQKPTPAGFRAYDVSWPQRMSRAGTFDANWVEHYFPGYPADVDWLIHNRAPEDQWFEGPLAGTEQFSFMNMHRTQPKVSGSLPGFRCRCFLDQWMSGSKVFREVELRLTTLVFFPHDERAILVWHGAHETADDTALDVATVLLAAETQENPRSPQHYESALRKRQDAEHGPLAMLDDTDLVPEGCGAVDPEIARVMDLLGDQGVLLANQRKRAERELESGRAIVAAEGLDPDEHGPGVPPPPQAIPTLQELPEFVRNLQAQAKQHEEANRARQNARNEELSARFTELGMNYDDIRAEYEKPAQGPPAFSAEAMIAKLNGIRQRCAEIGVTVDELEQMTTDEEMHAQWRTAEQELRRGYRLSAHFQGTVPRRTREESEDARRALVEGLAKGETFHGYDLTALDFSGLDLHGIDLRGALLESASFAGCNLAGADLSEVVLTRADLTGCVLDGAKLNDANLGEANLTGARGTAGVDLTGAILTRADLTSAVFPAARLERADLAGARFADTDMTAAVLAESHFLEVDLRGLCLRGANLGKATFLRCNLEGVDFTEATLNSVVFLGCRLVGAHFVGANLSGAKFVQGSVADGARFMKARMERANLRDTSAIEANFAEAQLDDADFSGANLERATLYRVVAKKARFTKANLTEADFVSANLMRASFEGSVLRGADLRDTNLYEADFARVVGDERTTLQGALQTGAKYHPKRRVEEDRT